MKMLLLFILSLSQAFAIEVSREGDRVYLWASSCQKLSPEVKAIASWSHRVAEAAKEDPACSCVNGKCTVDVTDTVPKLVRDTQGTYATNDGPNCWNTSLVGSRILSSLRYTTPDEMAFWMSSPLCRERMEDETPEPGDIIAIREGGREIHGFINLTPELCFSKNGYSHTAPYSLDTPSSVFSVYGVPEDCRRVYSTAIRPSCPLTATYLSCQSMDEYMASQASVSSELREQLADLNELECTISQMAMNGRAGTGDELYRLTATVVEALFRLAQSKIDDPKVSEHERFVWRGIYYKSNSLVRQLNMIYQ